MSEVAVLVIRVRKAQALEYERLFESSELPRWRDYHQRGLFKNARIFRSAFESHEGDEIANYVITVETAEGAHHEHDNDQGFSLSTSRLTHFNPRNHLSLEANPSSRSADHAGLVDDPIDRTP